ncbi:hypothetical protein ACTG16_23215 [Aeromonas sp. 23P]|uniref:hypothetical protein n=1 Tax=Aeromonas sp. 23P TaxID=3452716 RepID=UPI003F79B728|nr:hypothetical protein [Aeromonas veronii]
MDFTKYEITTPRPNNSEILVIAFGRVGMELREFPVDSFYEQFIGSTELAADPDFNCLDSLRPGMCSNEIEVVLRAHGFRTFLSCKTEDNSEARKAYQQEVDAKYAEFQRDLCIELSITDLPADFIEQVIDDACERLQFKRDMINIAVMQSIVRAVRKQLVICRSLIDALR